MLDTLLTTEQVAQYLKVDKFTVYRLVTQRKLPAYKVGNQWRFSEKLIDKWLRQNMNVRCTGKTTSARSSLAKS
jgi:excisionase family DNA binding protein